MGKRRSTIGGLMAMVLVLAIGLAALRNPSVLWVGTIFLATPVILALGAIGVVLRKQAERALVARLLRVRLGLPGAANAQSDHDAIHAAAHLEPACSPQTHARPLRRAHGTTESGRAPEPGVLRDRSRSPRTSGRVPGGPSGPSARTK